VKVNNFKVTFAESSHPAWVAIQHNGKEVLRLDHRELKDLEYALKRVRDDIRQSLPAAYKHEA